MSHPHAPSLWEAMSESKRRRAGSASTLNARASSSARSSLIASLVTRGRVGRRTLYILTAIEGCGNILIVIEVSDRRSYGPRAHHGELQRRDERWSARAR